MKHNICNSRSLFNSHSLALLGCGLLSLTALKAGGQTFARRFGPSIYYNTQSASFLNRSAAYNPLFSPQYYSGTSTTNGTLGTTNSYYGPPPPTNVVANGAAAPAQQLSGPQSQSSQSAADPLTAEFLSSGQLQVQWSGDVRTVKQVSLGIFDSNGKMLSIKVITSLPVQAVFTLPNTASYYGAQVQYSNGTTHTTYTLID